MDVETVKAKILEQVDKCRSSAMARAYGWKEGDDGVSTKVKQ